MTTTTKNLFHDEGEPSFVADAVLWETADRDEVVPDGDPRAAYLFCIPGQRISRRDAERFGLLEAKPAKAEAETSKRREPEENK